MGQGFAFSERDMASAASINKRSLFRSTLLEPSMILDSLSFGMEEVVGDIVEIVRLFGGLMFDALWW